MKVLIFFAPAISDSLRPRDFIFRGSIPHPMQSLCTLRNRRRRGLTQHSLPGGLLRPTWAGLPPAGSHQLCLAPHSFDHLVGAGEQCRWHINSQRLRGLHVDDHLVLIGVCTGRSTGFAPRRMRST